MIHVQEMFLSCTDVYNCLLKVGEIKNNLLKDIHYTKEIFMSSSVRLPELKYSQEYSGSPAELIRFYLPFISHVEYMYHTCL